MNLFTPFLITTFWIIGTACINVQLVIPKLVQEGSSPTLFCYYTLEGKPLYSVKWYRGQYEFYRYVPQAEPQLCAFPFSGIDIDMCRSNATQVTLKNVQKFISGKISCEVSVDVTFKTMTDSANLTITDVEVRKPYLNVSNNKLSLAEELQIICLADETDPPPLINFYIDNIKVNRSSVRDFGNGKAILNSNVLMPFVEQKVNHISPIWLRCDSYVSGFYHLSSGSVPFILKLSADIVSSTWNIYVSYYLLLGIVLKNVGLVCL